MRYLVVYRENPALAMSIPPPAMFEIVEASAAWIEEQKRTGRIDEGMFCAAEHGGVVFCDAKKPQDLLELIDSLPARPFCTVECTPLLSIPEWREAFAKIKTRALEQFTKMQSAMPHK